MMKMINRLKKIAFAAWHPVCWKALSYRVAPASEHVAAIRNLEFDLILDIGANKGQFSLVSKSLFPSTRIVAFEPQPTEYSIFKSLFGSYENIELYSWALGENSSVSKMYISARADSSSLLPIGELQQKIFPNTGPSGTIEVEVKSLDELESVWNKSHKALMKLDVQGFELSVLKGAERALSRCKYVYAECSEIEMYQGQPLLSDVESFLFSHNFKLVGRFNENIQDGKIVFADCLFEREA